MFLNFEKWHGCKNDFAIMWITKNDDLVLRSLIKQAPRLCSRDGTGIGADGLLVLQTDRADALMPEKLTIINSDGSIAQNCGNGIRCAASSVLKRHREHEHYTEIPEGFDLQLESSTVSCRYMARGKLNADRGTYPLVAVAMGHPKLGDAASIYDAAEKEVARIATELKVPALRQDYAVCEIGNPHIVFFLDQAGRDLLHRVGPAFQKSEYWDGINVHLAVTKEVTDKDQAQAANALGQTIGELYDVLVWERGAGPTQACGSGACAVGVAALASGLVSRADWLGIDMPGGRLYVKQEDEDDAVILAGPAELVYTGRIEI